MSKPNKAFDIPAINNEKEALMIFLKLDSDNAEDFAKVVQIDQFKLDCAHAPLSVIHAAVFEYENTRYHVAHTAARMKGVCNIAFNSNHWTIAPQPSAPLTDNIQSEPNPKSERISLYLTRTGKVAFEIFKTTNSKGVASYRYSGKEGAGCGTLKSVADSIRFTLNAKRSIKLAEGIDFLTLKY